MTQPESKIPHIAMAEYTLDLGIPIVNFLLRLKLADNEAHAQELITSNSFYINEQCINDVDTFIRSKHISGTALIRAQDRRVWVSLYTEDNGLR